MTRAEVLELLSAYVEAPGLAPAWRDGAACRASEVDVFFPIGEIGGDWSRAIAVCTDCAVRADCLAFAIATNQEYGVWGGTTEVDRRGLRRRWRRELPGASAAARPYAVQGYVT